MSEQWPYDEWNWSQLREEVDRLVAENQLLRTCASQRLAEIEGETLTYDAAFHKLEIACGALAFISKGDKEAAAGE